MCATRKTDFIVGILCYNKNSIQAFFVGENFTDFYGSNVRYERAYIFKQNLVWLTFSTFLDEPKSHQYRNTRFCIVMHIVAFLYRDNRSITFYGNCGPKKLCVSYSFSLLD